MPHLSLVPRAPRGAAIDAVIAEFGARHVLLRALRALLRPSPRRPPPLPASAHLRRDIGLEPLPDPPHYLEHLR